MMKHSQTGGRNVNRREAALPDSARPLSHAPLRIAIRLWGYDAAVAQTWLDSLPTLDGLIGWSIALAPDSPGAHMVVHMIKPSQMPGATFCWNCMGANRAIARMDPADGAAIALFAGHANALPPARDGLWMTSGALPPRAALFRLAHLIGAAAMPTSSGDFALRYHVLEMIGSALDAA
ncbi:hypothetical protein [Paraburkholderia sp. Ac-20347]|uniref:hypothetical protein n=1 Tax=Paraburkholderia sp. Ac-20347 TaxID=2703892 RepID=UPI00198227E7|nr:hypothetical protein [Paraburkholderia sp. Ac-20347]MBN3811008.1 hypothetical protein [Paraburkholderia sp. Ac-20347]